ncbi:hypothetical protein P175DRAFT_0531994 [Aspergillus ochraceoroseus IBT 24754]|uniref:Chitin synthesis regulation, resistance to congo red-domain-containing protein n=3 Tax=Aspergillus subgen. Nidulantes TaxID=2720870 RepID=A0A0F8X8K7_9EURO|nr:uncharacterized protein P175DRAFT_0531994 [Aspergillus ochraceoroseus IBT 24754]KKK17388.1 hypothetical protein AOCH_002021 [Aspergillus ochraceoroseus]KKK25905.1 hypothetical protein ARAM_003163 [Aspergillus rambellii]PTU20654.1 hypothetical protein P175DRAFT_0531994 [Aspergillus ochraceoroseus IBT 24754]
MGILYRRYCWYEYGNQQCTGDAWYDWGRWVAFAVIVVAALIIFFILACFNARRRRRTGLRPYQGTGWLAPPPPYQQQYADPYYQQQPPPPQYTAQPPTHGYFGGQQTGIELQSPPNVHYGGERLYQPPAGPPPPTNSKP